MRSIRLLTPLRWFTSVKTESGGGYSTSSCPSPTISKVVRLAVQLQQLETHFLCDAQKDSVHPLQCSVAQAFLRHLETKAKGIIGLEMLCLLRLSGGCAIAPQSWHDG